MRSMVEGGFPKGRPMWKTPSVSAYALPPPRAGEDILTAPYTAPAGARRRGSG